MEKIVLTEAEKRFSLRDALSELEKAASDLQDPGSHMTYHVARGYLRIGIAAKEEVAALQYSMEVYRKAWLESQAVCQSASSGWRKEREKVVDLQKQLDRAHEDLSELAEQMTECQPSEELTPFHAALAAVLEYHEGMAEGCADADDPHGERWLAAKYGVKASTQAILALEKGLEDSPPYIPAIAYDAVLALCYEMQEEAEPDDTVLDESPDDCDGAEDLPVCSCRERPSEPTC